jgi:hypothetical protein
MGEELDLIKTNSKTRFTYAMTATILTIALLAFGDLSPGGEVAAFSFMGVVAAGLGVSKFAEYWKKTL